MFSNFFKDLQIISSQRFDRHWKVFAEFKEEHRQYCHPDYHSRKYIAKCGKFFKIDEFQHIVLRSVQVKVDCEHEHEGECGEKGEEQQNGTDVTQYGKDVGILDIGIFKICF